MRGLLTDVNVQGYRDYLFHLMDAMDVGSLLDSEGLRLVTFRDIGLDRGLDDRTLWQYCQEEGWVLFTIDRNDDGQDSLTRTLEDSWTVGGLPVLTLSNQGRFANNRVYADRVAEDVATVLFGIASADEFRDQPRLYVPLRWP